LSSNIQYVIAKIIEKQLKKNKPSNGISSHESRKKIIKRLGIKKVRIIALARIEKKLRKLNFNKNNCKKYAGIKTNT